MGGKSAVFAVKKRGMGVPNSLQWLIPRALRVTRFGSPRYVKAFDWASDKFSSRISYDSTRFGDL